MWSYQNPWISLPHVHNRYSVPQFLHTLNEFTEHLYCSVLFEISITLFRVLRAFRVKQNVRKSVWKLARLKRSHVAKTDWWLLIVTDIAEYLETFKLRIWSHKETEISAHCLHSQTILLSLSLSDDFGKHLSVRSDLLHVSQYLDWTLVQAWAWQYRGSNRGHT